MNHACATSFMPVFRRVYNQRYLLFLLIPGLLYYVVFLYGPMYGMIIAFKDYDVVSGILGSPWVGLQHFRDFMESPFFVRIVSNTVLLSFFQLFFGFPVPIIFALLLNEVNQPALKRTIQSVSYLPHFVSVVIVIGLLKQLVSPTTGIINQIMESMGGLPVNFFMDKNWFRPLYILSGIWQEFGWGAIIYLAALANIDPQLYEAARMDGAGRLQCMLNITFPGLLPTVVIIFLLRLGQMLNIGFEKVLLMYNPAVYETADVISTFVYRTGLRQGDYSYSAAVDMLNALVIFVFIVCSNKLSRRFTDTGLW
jgi:putative aldouronate transport system permease protein